MRVGNAMCSEAARRGRIGIPDLPTLFRAIREQCVIVLLASLASVSPMATAVAASPDLSTVCDRAAVLAAAETGVPISVLKAISLIETGREWSGETRPWPWTVNMEGKGVWFETEDAALAYVDEHFKRGARSFDVGCFQINYKWHHEHFSSIEAMFDPANNARYAARFLLDLHAESGDWEEAAGAYHSRTPEYADRYRARFAGYRAQFLHEDGLPLHVVAVDPGSASRPLAPVIRVRVNSFPLLQSGGDTALGSLVPLAAEPAAGSLFRSDGAS